MDWQYFWWRGRTAERHLAMTSFAGAHHAGKCFVFNRAEFRRDAKTCPIPFRGNHLQVLPCEISFQQISH
jgi:hypothetical protein